MAASRMLRLLRASICGDGCLSGEALGPLLYQICQELRRPIWTRASHTRGRYLNVLGHGAIRRRPIIPTDYILASAHLELGWAYFAVGVACTGAVPISWLSLQGRQAGAAGGKSCLREQGTLLLRWPCCGTGAALLHAFLRDCILTSNFRVCVLPCQPWRHT